MGGVETARGIGYQHAYAVLTALEVLSDPSCSALRVEGTEDIMDIEVHDLSGAVMVAKQVKLRSAGYTWGKKALLDVLKRWAALDIADEAHFEFVTDGELGPSGEKVRDALEDAARGDRTHLAELLDASEESLICQRLTRARMVQDVIGVEAILLEAEREVRTLLPDARTSVDSDEETRRVVNQLYRLLSVRAADRSDDRRVVHKREIGQVLGGIENLTREDRWPDGLRASYEEIVSAEIFEGLVWPELRNLESDDASIPLSDLLQHSGPVIIGGPTGSGKTTLARLLRKHAAPNNRIALLAHAETYSPGRLDSFAAEAISSVLNRDIPTLTGRQILADRNVLLIIDGASEIPPTAQRSLREEIRGFAATNSGARLMLMGRDIALLKSMLPGNAATQRLLLKQLGAAERLELVKSSPKLNPRGDIHAARTLVSQVEHALGDAAGNPLLFSLAIELLNDGVEFTDRKSIYEATISQLGERGGATDIALSNVVFGIIFNQLLDEGRRYANPYEWHRLIASTTKQMSHDGIVLEPSTVHEAGERSGLIIPIGHSQIRAPVHDSFADFFAGVSLAEDIVQLPTMVSSNDEQRLLFAAQAGGVSEGLARLTARDLPYLTVTIAPFDTRVVDSNDLREVMELFHLLVPEDECRVPVMRREGDRIVASLAASGDTWMQQSIGRLGHGTPPTAICSATEGPLAIAVRLWRLVLQERLQTFDKAPSRNFSSGCDARSALERHAIAEKEAVTSLIDKLAPDGRVHQLSEAVGPTGLTASIYAAEERLAITYWPVLYRRTDQIDISFVDGPLPTNRVAEAGETSVDYFLRHGPEGAASARLRAALNGSTIAGWL